MPVAIKRVYEKPVRSDGVRVLVDRLWPRGLGKDAAAVHSWLKALAPSDALRRWFHVNPQHWVGFRKRYLKELFAPPAAEALEQLYDLSRKRKRVTLLFASKDSDHNNAAVLKELLEGMRKPPSSTGPGRASAVAIRKRARAPR